MESVVDPMTQGLEIYKKINDTANVPIYWQRGLPPNASYLHVQGGIAKHMILPLPFDPIRQLAALHEYSSMLSFDNAVPDKFIKKPKLAYTDKASYKKLVVAECWAWNYAIGLVMLKKWKFEPEHLGLVMNEWGLSRYFTNYAKPDKLLRQRVFTILHDAEHATPGFLKLPSTQKLLSDASF